MQLLKQCNQLSENHLPLERLRGRTAVNGTLLFFSDSVLSLRWRLGEFTTGLREVFLSVANSHPCPRQMANDLALLHDNRVCRCMYGNKGKNHTEGPLGYAVTCIPLHVRQQMLPRKRQWKLFTLNTVKVTSKNQIWIQVPKIRTNEI